MTSDRTTRLPCALLVACIFLASVEGHSQATPAAVRQGSPTTDTTTAPRAVEAPRSPDFKADVGVTTRRPEDPKDVDSATLNGEEVTCRNVRVTGSRLQTRRVCTSTSSEKAAADWASEQQARGGMAASGNINDGG